MRKRRVPRNRQEEIEPEQLPVGQNTKDGEIEYLPHPKWLNNTEVTFNSAGLFNYPSNRENVYVGIDSSVSNLAIVALGDSGRYHWWLNSPKIVKNASEVDKVNRLIKHEEYLNIVTTTINMQSKSVSKVFMEGYGFSSQTLAPSAELAGLVKVQVIKTFKTINLVAPTQLKKFATNSGRAEKSDIKLAVYKYWGVEFSDDNLADAFVLAQMAKASVTGAKTKFQEETLKKIVK